MLRPMIVFTDECERRFMAMHHLQPEWAAFRFERIDLDLAAELSACRYARHFVRADLYLVPDEVYDEFADVVELDQRSSYWVRCAYFEPHSPGEVRELAARASSNATDMGMLIPVVVYTSDSGREWSEYEHRQPEWAEYRFGRVRPNEYSAPHLHRHMLGGGQLRADLYVLPRHICERFMSVLDEDAKRQWLIYHWLPPHDPKQLRALVQRMRG